MTPQPAASPSDHATDPAATALRPFARSLPMQMMRAREAVMQRFRPHLRAHGMTDQQWRVIRMLAEAEAVEISELGARCCIHAASLSRILPNLEAEGIVARRPNAQDHRRVIVTITPRGRRLFATIAPRSEAIYAAIAREIGPDMTQQLYRALDHVIEVLSEQKAHRPPRGKARRPVMAADRTGPIPE